MSQEKYKNRTLEKPEYGKPAVHVNTPRLESFVYIINDKMKIITIADLFKTF
jgi:hypothetical protein